MVDARCSRLLAGEVIFALIAGTMTAGSNL
jgi:hypothetical protein